MKKTQYTFMVSEGSVYNYKGIWRRVYEQDGRYFVKYEGRVIDVTKVQDKFVKD